MGLQEIEALFLRGGPNLGIAHRHAFAAEPLEQAFRFEQTVGARNRHGIDGMKLSYVAHRREQLAGGKLPARHQAPNLRGDLPKDRLGGGRLDNESSDLAERPVQSSRHLHYLTFLGTEK